VTVVRRPLQPMVCSGRLTLRSPKRDPLRGPAMSCRRIYVASAAPGKPTSNSMFD
jgi:hypothetical protein